MPTDKSLQVNSLDFDQIKLSIRNFLSNQTVFKDYDFEGSGLSVLLDVLSYTTYYQGIYNHLSSNELFLDTAVKRSSVVSHAKSLGYTPRSRTAATAVVDITTTDSGSYLRRGTIFNARQNDISYKFVASQDFDVSDGESKNVSIKEGVFKSKSFVVPNNKNNQSFVLDENNIDTSTIRVSVQRSISDSTGLIDVWSNASSIVDVKSDSKAYFVEETFDGYPSILFGDDVIGQKLSAGNLVTVTYIITKGPEANGIGSNDSTNNPTFNLNANSTVSVVSQAAGGEFRESTDSIRYNAPKSYTTQNRAVTQDDFESLVRSNFSGFDAVYTYGGEQSNPPEYGRVFVALKPSDGRVITTGQKVDIQNYLKKRTSIALEPIVVESEPLYVLLITSLFYSPENSVVSESVLSSSALQTITNYVSTRTKSFNTVLSGSLIEKEVLDNYDAINTAITQVTLERRVDPNPIKSEYVFDFKNELNHPHPGHVSVISSNLIRFTNDDNEVFDGFFDDDGKGLIRFYSIVNGQRVYRNTNLGTVNYRTGVIQLRSINLTLAVGETDIRFRGVSRFGRVASKELNTLTFDSDYNLSNQVILYNQNLVPPPQDGKTFVTVNSTDAVLSTDVQYTTAGIASSGVATPVTSTATTTTSTTTTTTTTTSGSGGGSSTPSSGGGGGGGGYY